MPAPKKSPSKPSSSKSSPGKKPFGKKPFDKKPGAKPADKSSPGKSSPGKKPFGKKPAGKMNGPKSFKKRRRPEENLDIQYTDKELGELSVIKRKLQEIREYKKILAEDGMKPDQQDKERESELIVRLLRIEKNAKMAARQRAKAAKTEAFRDAAEKAEFAKQKKKSRDDRFADEDGDSDDDYRPRKRRDYDDDDY